MTSEESIQARRMRGRYIKGKPWKQHSDVYQISMIPKFRGKMGDEEWIGISELTWQWNESPSFKL